METETASDPPPTIRGMGVAVLECPQSFTPDDVTAAVRARWPGRGAGRAPVSCALLYIDQCTAFANGKPSQAFARARASTTWRRIDVWCDEDMLGPTLILERAKTALPFYVRAFFVAMEPGTELSDAEADDLGQRLIDIVAELSARHGVSLIDFEPTDEFRRGPDLD